jgi:two-component system cell cycle response regulator DivK
MVRGRPLILVVDDFRDGREMYAEYLSHAGFDVAQAADGEEAVAKARELLPDVVLMDLSLPGMDGWEATRVLKADARTRDMRVIALTAHALSVYADSARAAGCDSVVTKPCLPPDLAAEIRRQLDARANREPTEEPAR